MAKDVELCLAEARAPARPDAGRRARPAAVDAGGRRGVGGRRPHRVRPAVEELDRPRSSGRDRGDEAAERGGHDASRHGRYEVVAVRYGTLRAPQSELFHRYESYGEPDEERRDGLLLLAAPPGRRRPILVDTGFDPAVGARRGRTCLCAAARGARARSAIEPGDVSRRSSSRTSTTTTSGTSRPSREAELIVPRKELEFWTGPHAARDQFASHVEAAEIALLDAGAPLGARPADRGHRADRRGRHGDRRRRPLARPAGDRRGRRARATSC